VKHLSADLLGGLGLVSGQLCCTHEFSHPLAVLGTVAVAAEVVVAVAAAQPWWLMYGERKGEDEAREEKDEFLSLLALMQLCAKS
jgi:hypothetical protein